MAKKIKTIENLEKENEELRARLELSEGTIDAIRRGEVDAVVVNSPEGDKVYTLSGAEHTYSILIEAMNEGALVLSPEGVILYCNRTFAAMLGKPPYEVLGCSIYDFINEKDVESLRHMLNQSPIDKARQEIQLKSDVNNAVPTLFSIGSIEKEEESLFSAVVIDLTEQKKTEDKLEDYKKNLEEMIAIRTKDLKSAYDKLAATEKSINGILNSITDAFIAINNDWRFSYINEGALDNIAARIGKSEADLIGKVIWEEFPDFRKTILFEHFSYVMDHYTPRSFEYFQPALDVWYSLSIYPHADGITIYCRDITDIKKIEHALKERTYQLESTNKELEAFAYSLSHDLRGPLRALDGFSQTVLEDYRDVLDATGRDYLMRIQSAAQTMAQIIEGMLKLSEVIRCELRWETFSLSEIAVLIAKDLAEKDPKREIEFAIAPDVFADGDSSLLRIALYNLMENAWKFSTKIPQAKIEFTSIEKEGETIYLMRDNGIGFDMQYAHNLFQPFQRLHTGDFPGQGIGLATVQRVIRRHGGRIWAESEVGKGTTFYFTLADSGSCS